jgi:DNA-binding NtrC family response regulator
MKAAGFGLHPFCWRNGLSGWFLSEWHGHCGPHIYGEGYMQSNILSFSSHGTVLLSPGHRVLLAEDDTEFRHLLARVLERDGYDVRQVADGQQLVEWLAYFSDLGSIDASCNLIISDIRMPGYSGLDVLTSLRCLHSRIPVIVITAFGDDAAHRLAIKLGAAAFLSKPFDMADLRTIALNAVSTATLRRQSALGSKNWI